MANEGSREDPETASLGQLPAALARSDGRLEQAISTRLSKVPSPVLQSALERSTSGGKRLRPLLALWFSDSLGVASDNADRIACLTEWLHSAFLIHDDIQDGDEWRRDQPTLWKSHGISTALNAADWLLSAVYLEVSQMLLQDEIRARLLSAVQDVHSRTVLGQQYDLDGRGDPDFGLDRYEQAVRAKTGRYLALGMVAVAIVVRLNQRAVDQLWAVGDHLGPAFQIQDDLLDLTSSKGRAGQLGNDIREGKPSILYAHALERGQLAQEQKARLVDVMAEERALTRDDDVEWVISLFHDCGSIDFARNQAVDRAEAGIDLFRDIPGVPRELHATFEQVARFAVERNR